MALQIISIVEHDLELVFVENVENYVTFCDVPTIMISFEYSVFK